MFHVSFHYFLSTRSKLFIARSPEFAVGALQLNIWCSCAPFGDKRHPSGCRAVFLEKSVDFFKKSVDLLKKGVDFLEKVALQISVSCNSLSTCHFFNDYPQAPPLPFLRPFCSKRLLRRRAEGMGVSCGVSPILGQLLYHCLKEFFTLQPSLFVYNWSYSSDS